MAKNGARRKRYSIQWEMSDRKLSAADVERIEDLLASLIARLIIAERSTAANADGHKKDDANH